MCFILIGCLGHEHVWSWIVNLAQVQKGLNGKSNKSCLLHCCGSLAMLDHKMTQVEKSCNEMQQVRCMSNCFFRHGIRPIFIVLNSCVVCQQSDENSCSGQTLVLALFAFYAKHVPLCLVRSEPIMWSFFGVHFSDCHCHMPIFPKCSWSQCRLTWQRKMKSRSQENCSHKCDGGILPCLFVKATCILLAWLNVTSTNLNLHNKSWTFCGKQHLFLLLLWFSPYSSLQQHVFQFCTGCHRNKTMEWAKAMESDTQHCNSPKNRMTAWSDGRTIDWMHTFSFQPMTLFPSFLMLDINFYHQHPI